MQVGTLNQKARPALSVFVVACMIVTVGLLFVMQKSVATADNLNKNDINTGWQNYL